MDVQFSSPWGDHRNVWGKPHIGVVVDRFKLELNWSEIEIESGEIGSKMKPTFPPKPHPFTAQALS